jgi:hypothetical protein
MEKLESRGDGSSICIHFAIFWNVVNKIINWRQTYLNYYFILVSSLVLRVTYLETKFLIQNNRPKDKKQLFIR